MKLLAALAVALACPAAAAAWDTEPPAPEPCVAINLWHPCPDAPPTPHCVQINQWHCLPIREENV